MTALSILEHPYYGFGLGTQGGSSSEEAQALFAQPGQVYEVVISDWHVHPDGVHWGQCYESQATLPFKCDLGLLLDRGGSAQFFEKESASQGWIAFSWGIYPHEAIPLVTVPATCP